MSKGLAKVVQSISDGRNANKLRSFLLTRLLLSPNSGVQMALPIPASVQRGSYGTAEIETPWFVVFEISVRLRELRRLSKYDIESPVGVSILPRSKKKNGKRCDAQREIKSRPGETHLPPGPETSPLLNPTPLSACFKQTNTYRMYHGRQENGRPWVWGRKKKWDIKRRVG